MFYDNIYQGVLQQMSDNKIQELQTTLATALKELETLIGEKMTVEKSLIVLVTNPVLPEMSAVYREQDMPRLIFEQRRLIMQTRIEILKLESPPLLARLRSAQAAAEETQATYHQAMKDLISAQKATDDAASLLTNNNSECLALEEELAQSEFEYALEEQAQRTGKSVRVTLGPNGRPSRKQPEIRRK